MPDYTILLIDYDPKSIDKMRRTLTGCGYGFELAKNGVEGLDQFKRSRPSMVLVEAMLPKKHGFEVCSEIKNSEQGADVPVVIITAVYRGRKYRSQAFHMYKCDEYLEKPLSDEKLLETVRRFLPGEPTVAAPVEPTTTRAPEPAAEVSADASPEPSGTPVEDGEAVATSEPTDASSPRAAASPRPAGPAAKKDNGAPVSRSASVASSDDENMADFTEEDILSALDAIMPDEKPAKRAKSASG